MDIFFNQCRSTHRGDSVNVYVLEYIMGYNTCLERPSLALAPHFIKRCYGPTNRGYIEIEKFDEV